MLCVCACGRLTVCARGVFSAFSHACSRLRDQRATVTCSKRSGPSSDRSSAWASHSGHIPCQAPRQSGKSAANRRVRSRGWLRKDCRPSLHPYGRSGTRTVWSEHPALDVGALSFARGPMSRYPVPHADVDDQRVGLKDQAFADARAPSVSIVRFARRAWGGPRSPRADRRGTRSRRTSCSLASALSSLAWAGPSSPCSAAHLLGEKTDVRRQFRTRNEREVRDFGTFGG